MSSIYLEKLQVTNFRNLKSDIINFTEGINCIFGDNGNGKTNLLEAIHILIHKKSFRKKTSFPQFFSIDSEETEIIFSSIFNAYGKKKALTAKISNNLSVWSHDQTIIKNKQPYKCIFINPFDSYNFFNSASFRRKWFDDNIILWDNNYKKLFKNYNNSLRFRNTLLSKKPSSFEDQIYAIDEKLSELSKQLIEIRIFFLEEMKIFFGKIFKTIFAEKNDLQIHYESKFTGLTSCQIAQKLNENMEKDKIIGFTSYGIHKDDYYLYFNGLNSLDYCSLGQQKMSYLSLVFAYIELLRYKYEVYPLVLIDDVSGELDQKRWCKLIDFLKTCDYQVFITTANEGFKKELIKIENATKIIVKNGAIIKN